MIIQVNYMVIPNLPLNRSNISETVMPQVEFINASWVRSLESVKVKFQILLIA